MARGDEPQGEAMLGGERLFPDVGVKKEIGGLVQGKAASVSRGGAKREAARRKRILANPTKIVGFSLDAAQEPLMMADMDPEGIRTASYRAAPDLRFCPSGRMRRCSVRCV